MNRMEKTTKIIIKYLAKNPLSSAREISDNASRTRINHNTTKKIVASLIKEYKISNLFRFYYITPSKSDEVEFLIQITDTDKILRPRFKKQLKDSENEFQKLIKEYIDLFHLQIKIKKVDKKTNRDFLIKECDEIRKDLKAHLQLFKDKKATDVEFHGNLSKHIADRYFKDSRHIHDLIIHGKAQTLKDKVRMLSTFFKSNNIREATDEFNYESNKIPRKIINAWFYENGNIKIDELWAGWFNGEITAEEFHDAMRLWFAYIALSKKTLHGVTLDIENKKKVRKILKKEYQRMFRRDMDKDVDITAYDIS